MMANVHKVDARIAAALQVDGRASWSSIAHVLGESERTVHRRGTQLLQDGLVTVAARPVNAGDAVIVDIECEPGRTRAIARSVATRRDAVIVHVVTGKVDCVAVLRCPRSALPGLLLEELSSIRGVVRTAAQPALRQVHSIAEWQPGVLTNAEIDALTPRLPEDDVSDRRVDPIDEHLVRALERHGRSAVEELARLTGLSDTTVRRRIASLRVRDLLAIRAIVDPALFGLNTEAMLRVTVHPFSIDEVASELGESPYVRFVAVTCGAAQLFVLVALPDDDSLYAFVTSSPWVERVQSINVSLVLTSEKRGGVLTTST